MHHLNWSNIQHVSTAMDPVVQLKAMCILRKKKEMPAEPVAAAEWLLPKLLSDLSASKTIPLKLNHLKHQQALCS